MLSRAFSILQILSIDIVLGAVILLHFFSIYSGVSPSNEVYFVLGATVWLIYTIDHLRDAKKAPHSTRVRYRFHLKNEKKIRVAILTVFLSVICFLFFLDQSILVGGFILALFSAIYLIIQKRLAKLGLKELYVAIIYTSGILLAPFVLMASFSITMFMLVLLLTYTNLILFSWFEREEDINDQFISIATIMESKRLESLILICLALGISLSLLQHLDALTGYFTVAFSIYSLLFVRAVSLKKDQLYRTMGDGVFLLPILFELLSFD